MFEILLFGLPVVSRDGAHGHVDHEPVGPIWTDIGKFPSRNADREIPAPDHPPPFARHNPASHLSHSFAFPRPGAGGGRRRLRRARGHIHSVRTVCKKVPGPRRFRAWSGRSTFGL